MATMSKNTFIRLTSGSHQLGSDTFGVKKRLIRDEYSCHSAFDFWQASKPYMAKGFYRISPMPAISRSTWLWLQRKHVGLTSGFDQKNLDDNIDDDDSKLSPHAYNGVALGEVDIFSTRTLRYFDQDANFDLSTFVSTKKIRLES
jgi:hypothetical protein